jgi:hypothetical protein
MLGAFRGMPTWVATFVVSLSACSQDPQFVEKDLTSALMGSDDLTAESCDALASASAEALPTQCLIFKAQLSVEPSVSELTVGDARTLKAVLLLSDGRSFDVTSQAVWSVNDVSKAEISKSGYLKAVASGTIGVKAVYYKSSGLADVKINAPFVAKDPKVTLKIDGVLDGSLKSPAGRNLQVTWDSQDVESCRLIANDRELDRRSSGTIDVRVTENQQISAICVADGVDDIRDDIQVTVTRPRVDLVANSSRDDLTLNGQAAIDVRWTSENAEQCELLTNGVKLAAGLSGALNHTVLKSQRLEAICKDAVGNAAASAVNIALQYQTKFSFGAGYYDKIAGNKTIRPVSIMFALDVTGSMAGQIQTVKDGVQDFVTQLHTRGFAPKIGVIPFRDKVPEGSALGDVPEGRLELTDNVEDVKRFVGTLRASGGGDANEASLGAIRSAMTALRNGDQRPDAIKIIMVVTDQPGHNGGSTTDCALDSIVGQFSVLTDEEQKTFKLFYSTPTTGSSCSGFANGSIQMSTLLSKVLQAETTVAARGGLIAWPFANKNLVNDVVAMLERVNPDIELACLNTKATLTVGGSDMFTHNLSDYAGSFRLVESGQSQVIAKTLSDEQYAALEAGPAQIMVSNCCFSKAAAKAGKFDACLKDVTSGSVPFTVD